MLRLQFNCNTGNDFCKGCKIVALTIATLAIIAALTIVLFAEVTTVVASIEIIFIFATFHTAKANNKVVNAKSIK